MVGQAEALGKLVERLYTPCRHSSTTRAWTEVVVVSFGEVEGTVVELIESVSAELLVCLTSLFWMALVSSLFGDSGTCLGDACSVFGFAWLRVSGSVSESVVLLFFLSFVC